MNCFAVPADGRELWGICPVAWVLSLSPGRGLCPTFGALRFPAAFRVSMHSGKPRIPKMKTRPFNLSRWFAAVGLVSVTAISVIAAALFSRLMSDRMLNQEAALTQEFVQRVVLAGKSGEYFVHNREAGAMPIEDSFRQLGRMPDVLRANVHSRDRVIVWSSDKALVGRHFVDNPELDEALAGRLVVHGGPLEKHYAHAKREHVALDPTVEYFVEIYLPVLDEAGGEVMGVVELYKNPRHLFEALQTAKRYIWVGATAAGLFLYLTLFWMVRRADNLIRAQQERLVESETLAAVGEMGSAVAHGIRNPLASIRSSAELALDADSDTAREASRDIIAEADRLESWVNNLLSYSRPLMGELESVQVQALLQGCLGSFEREFEKRGIAFAAQVAASVPPIKADPMLIAQVFNSLIANAMEAITGAGRIDVSAASADGGTVSVKIADSGAGMGPEQLKRIFKPFYTTKPKGLGVGLPLAKRIVERFGGAIKVRSAPGQGTTVEVVLPAA